MSLYGDGSDGALNVTSGTYSLSLDHKYQFSSVNIAAGATLSTGSPTGSVLYILCSGTFTLNGFIDVSSKVNRGANTWSVTIDGDTYNSPSVEEGADGSYTAGNAGGAPGNGFGGGGAGGTDNENFYLGGNGGSGASPFGTPGAVKSVSAGAGTQSGGAGFAGSGSAGGSGAAWAANAAYANSGIGGTSYGATGGNASAGSLSPPAGGAIAGGGGGAGGHAGRPGVHVVIKAKALVLNGEVHTSGSAGGNGGRGGNAATLGVYDVEAGAGGGGGGGGNAGNIYLTYSDSLTGTLDDYMSGGSGGTGGVSPTSVNAGNGDAGNAGSSSIFRSVLLESGAGGGGVATATFESASIDIISGGIAFGKANYSTVIQAIPQKDYEYRVFDSSGNYLATWKDITSDFNYSQSINQNASELTVKIARSPNNRVVKYEQLLDNVSSPILDNNSDPILLATETPNSVGPDTDVKENYNVDVYAFYGGYDNLIDETGDNILDENFEPILTQYGNPNGLRVYSGYIIDYELTYGAQTGVEVRIAPNATEMDHYVFKDGSNTTVSYASTDPVQMARDNMDSYIAQGGIITYDTASMPLSGGSSPYDFKLQTTREVNDKAIDLLPSGYYHFVDPGENKQYLLNKAVTAHHTFYYEKHITEFKLRKSISQLINKGYFVGGETGIGTTLYKYYQDATSISDYRPGLDRQSDSRVTLDDSADAIMESRIEQYKVPRYRSSIEISDAVYDIETIKLGQMVAFKNFGTFVDSLILQIVTLNKSKHSVTLDLDMIVPDDTKRLFELKRELRSQDVRDIANAPT